MQAWKLHGEKELSLGLSFFFYVWSNINSIHMFTCLRVYKMLNLVTFYSPGALYRISKAKVNEYSERIEAIAAKLATPVVRLQLSSP